VILAQQVDRAGWRFSAATSGRADNPWACGKGGHPGRSGDMMVRCAPGNGGCVMTSVLSCWPSCSFGTLSWPPRQRRSRPRCWSWKTNRKSVTRSRPNCGRYVSAGQCPSMRDGDGSWMRSSRTLMTSPGGRNAAPGGRPPISGKPRRVAKLNPPPETAISTLGRYCHPAGVVTNPRPDLSTCSAGRRSAAALRRLRLVCRASQ
jgi:hypothetical protein